MLLYIPYVLLGLFIILSIITFAYYGVDKSKAKRSEMRIPERTLLCLSFFGGALGGLLGMQLFRHKTKKPRFWIINILGLTWQILAIVLLIIFA